MGEAITRKDLNLKGRYRRGARIGKWIEKFAASKISVSVVPDNRHVSWIRLFRVVCTIQATLKMRIQATCRDSLSLSLTQTNCNSIPSSSSHPPPRSTILYLSTRRTSVAAPPPAPRRLSPTPARRTFMSSSPPPPTHPTPFLLYCAGLFIPTGMLLSLARTVLPVRYSSRLPAAHIECAAVHSWSLRAGRPRHDLTDLRHHSTSTSPSLERLSPRHRNHNEKICSGLTEMWGGGEGL